MKIPSLSPRRAVMRRQHQQGAALIIAMILLMIMTLLAVTGLRSTNQQERMSANAYDRDLAFQAAEAALRAGELKAAETDDGAFPTSACDCNKDGLCAQPNETCATRWGDTPSPFVSVSALDLVAADTPQLNPQYMIEKLGRGLCAAASSSTSCRNFRITARSDDAAGSRSTVILQSIYAAP
jgi:type IV pilus assembly protein PilX